MADRRDFLKLSLAGSAGLLVGCNSSEEKGAIITNPIESLRPSGALIVSTWNHGIAANEKAWSTLESHGSVLDAVEQGVAIVESDFSNRSVGLGGRPDRDGIVTLDACIQDHDGKAGAVAFIQRFEHPISIARAIMERTPHVMLVGAGAEKWALENGFKQIDIDIPEVQLAYEEWLRTSDYKPIANRENHDTIGMLAMDAEGRIAGSCTTSGMAFKIHGRVGDSPIIGAGLFVDGDVGAACATGVGELMIRTAGCHTVVELMRQGFSPMDACREAVLRILAKHPNEKDLQVGFLALNKAGKHGAWSAYEGFNYALSTSAIAQLANASFERKFE
ncbi:MAG: N(4)-(beta-N-acetylglucosaminyl)-L-asparaginase [Flavobacteriales bacterium]|nr:N(4)-(beta-N-acetylglucosaminyl)-L-asparaginase [Flavobacteriales bacterium]MBK6945195.1 N(4)-(beta-N-acetylglucosaminyl)-L-asparaginase [Flavobacteriales bacterium]MBK7239544.1 N(4)-(beta-N-acetylglucosaminyl)-L-asparaginase [Flavobacteriales bacterium]MBK9535249.1 N(4)-(beta-N-acetylglucosaminyl)-L-asparaginase [Flavobacteriales bacterium]MBP9137776.1 N(4)-(beta-N-acetylglucosaminyl)-L-asparaginase [Flavobacteriales bacterium]